MSETYKMAKAFKRKYPLTVAWRIKQHCKIIDKHLNHDEQVKYVFLGQKNNGALDFTNTNVVVLTNKRLMLATKRILFGYFFTSITPDMFNDLGIKKNIIWGRVVIDTIKEEVSLSNISPSALPEIETNVVDYMMRQKKKYNDRFDQNKKNRKK